MQKIIVILGQTATGKSDFAVEVAQKIKSEVISADSRQVYRGMNLGTGKITRKEMSGVKHHLLDIVSPKKYFSVNDFQKLASKEIEKILESGKTPIICGGTAFYIDTLINKTKLPEVPPNKKLRAKLEKETTEKLFEMLKKLDPERAKNIDQKNRVRLIRAIEIAKAFGQVPSTRTAHSGQDPLSARQGLAENCLAEDHTSPPTNSARAEFVGNSNFNVLKIGLTLPPEILKERIRNRLLARIKKGMIREIKNLHEKEKISWKRLYDFGLEYRYVSLYLQKSKNLSSLKLRQAKSEMIEKLNTEIWHFAKRQKTWWKRDQNIIWIDPRKKSEKVKVIKKIKNFLK